MPAKRASTRLGIMLLLRYYERAIAECQKLLDLDPIYPLAHFVLAAW